MMSEGLTSFPERGIDEVTDVIFAPARNPLRGRFSFPSPYSNRLTHAAVRASYARKRQPDVAWDRDLVVGNSKRVGYQLKEMSR